jgi:hypothetical protein
MKMKATAQRIVISNIKVFNLFPDRFKNSLHNKLQNGINLLRNGENLPKKYTIMIIKNSAKNVKYKMILGGKT